MNTKEPRPETDGKELSSALGHDHVEIETTNQDLPDNVKTFMGKEVVAQRKFDDKTAQRFLQFYAATGRKGASARAAGVSYNVIRHWEVNDEDFGSLILEAKQLWLESLEREAFRRGVEGTLVPVVGGKDPEIVTYKRQYSDKLLELLMKKADPTGYGNKETNVSVNVNTGVLVAPTASTEEDTPFAIEEVDEES
jgi:hypothetical protein